MKFIIIMASVLIISLPHLSRADVYTWVDKNGVKHFSNEPPPEGVEVISKSREIPLDEAKDREREEKDSQTMQELEQELSKENTESTAAEKPTLKDDNKTDKIIEIESGGGTYTESDKRARERINPRNELKRGAKEEHRESASDSRGGGARK